jgi:hypothetical protein
VRLKCVKKIEGCAYTASCELRAASQSSHTYVTVSIAFFVHESATPGVDLQALLADAGAGVVEIPNNSASTSACCPSMISSFSLTAHGPAWRLINRHLVCPYTWYPVVAKSRSRTNYIATPYSVM